MGRKSIAEERRNEILDSYVQVIYEEGFENTSIAKIARHMDVPPSLIMHYFKTKEEMVYALIDDFFFEEVVASIEEIREISDPEDRLRTWLFDSLLNPRENDPEFYELSLIFQYLGCRDEKIAARIQRSWNYLTESLRSDLQEAMREGIIPEGDAGIMARTIWTTIIGTDIFRRFTEEDSPEELFSSLRSMIAGMIGIKAFEPRSDRKNDNLRSHRRWKRR